MALLTSGDYVAVISLGLLLCVGLYGLWKGLDSKSSGIQVKRGAESWGVLGGAFGTILAANVFFLVNSTFSGGLKDGLYVGAFLVAAYLCYENHWFQNKLMGLRDRFVEKRRGHS